MSKHLAIATFLLCLLVTMAPDTGTSGHAVAARSQEHVVPGPSVADPAQLPPQIPATLPPVGVQGASTGTSPVAPFLTLPYVGPHYVTSIFDHCNPTYVADKRICRFDGVEASTANGTDPGFARGYAMTKGTGNYLYYDGHNGWDYGLSYEPVVAAADGVVSTAGLSDAGCTSCGYGLTVIVDHANGISTRYAHLSRIDVRLGETVGRGQRVGISGNTGASTGPHLHFGVYVTSTWTAIDPFGWSGSGPDPWPSDVGNLWLAGVPQTPVPVAPSGVFATSGNGYADVRWNSPAPNGVAVTGYTITASPGGSTASAPANASAGVISGLTNGTPYTFTVTAVSASGSGPASAASNSVTPLAVPAAPVDVMATGTNGGALVSWVPSASGGGAVSGYTVTEPNGVQVTAPGNATSARVPNLANGTSHSFSVSATNGAGAGAAGTAAPVTPSATTYYFAEGYTGDGFSETLDLLMPDSDGTAVVEFFTEAGSSARNVNMAAGKVAVLDVNAAVGGGHQVSARVTLPFGGVVERHLRFANAAWNGSTDSVGTAQPGPEWNFAEGTTLPGFSEYLTLQNPNPAPATVDLSYFLTTGERPVKTLALPARSRATIEVFTGDLNSNSACSPGGGGSCGIGPGAEGVSIKVRSRDQPIVAERPLYLNGFSFGAGPIRGGHVAFGAPAAQNRWTFAEGNTLPGFNEYLSLENSGVSDANVTLTYNGGDGAVITKNLVSAARRRTTVKVFGGSPAGGSCSVAADNCGVGPNVGELSVQISSDQPIVAERPLYMVHDFGSGPVAGATVVVGAPNLAQRFAFAMTSSLSGDNDFLTIANPGGSPAAVMVAYYTPGGTVTRKLTLPPSTRHTIQVNDSSEGVGPGQAPVGVVVSGDSQILVEKPSYSVNGATYGATDTVGQASDTFFFAEGYTGAGFRESLSILSPNGAGTAHLDLYTESTHLSGTATLLAGVVTTVDVNALVGAGHQVAARVVLPGGGVVQRLIDFDNGSWHGSIDNVGVTAPRAEWDFAEGSTLTVFNEYLSLFNPNSAPATVDLTYFTDGGQHPVKTLTVAAGRRASVEVFSGSLNDDPSCTTGAGGSCGVGAGIQGVSVQVKSRDQSVVAERPMYVNGYDFGSGPIRDGHDAFGAAGPARRWYFAEGTTLPGFNEFLSLQNPGAADAHVTLDYFTESGSHSSRTLVVAAHSRSTLQVFDGTLGVGAGVGGVATQVSSDQPIVAERPMYVVRDFGMGLVAGASDVVGSPGLANLFGFAGISTQAGDATYLTIENPGAQAARVDLTYFTASGPLQRTVTVAAGSRHTVGVSDPAEGIGSGAWEAGLVAHSDQPVMIEKPTYGANPWNYGATDTLGAMPASF